MDASNMSTPTTSNSSHQETISASPSSFYDTLPSFLPTFRSSASSAVERPSSSSSSPLPPPTTASSAAAPSSSSKKRSRASRRAPTTVLTTDPSNFRSMVQQFTGFPSSSSSFLSLPFPQSQSTPSSASVPPPSLVDAIVSSINFTNPTSCPFLNPTSMLGVPSSSIPMIQPPAAPQYGDLGSLFAAPNSAGLHHHHQQPQLGLRFGGGGGPTPGWQDQRSSTDGDQDLDQLREPEKRHKSSDGFQSTWSHSSDDH